jgi:hypothetical protein
LQEIIEALSGSPSGNPPPGTEDELKWYLNEIISILKGSGGESYLGVFVREFNGLVGIGVSVDASGNPPAVSGQEGDRWFTLAFNDSVNDGLPTGWIIIPWEYLDGAWDFSSMLLPIAAKDLHWVAVKNGTDIEGHYVILSGPEELDTPEWELLGAAAVVPDGKTIGYNENRELEVKPHSVSVLTWSDYFTPVNSNIQVQDGASMYRSSGEARLRLPFVNTQNIFNGNAAVFNPISGMITTPNLGTFYGVLYTTTGGLVGTCWTQPNNVLLITPLPGTTIAANTGLVLDINFPL